jgi:colanic acid/amylovoran biosynthesis glycosyltransferase
VGESAGRPVIVYVLRNYPQLSQTFVRNEIVGLRDSGVDVRVYSLYESGPGHIPPEWAGPWEKVHTVPLGQSVRDHLWWLAHHPARLFAAYRVVARLPRRRNLANSVRRIVSLARPLAHSGVQGVHTHFAWQGVVPVLLLGALWGAPTSVTLHAKDIYLPDPDLPRWLRLLSRTVTVCEYNRDYLSARGLQTRSMSVVPCGVELPSHIPEPVGMTISTVGRLVEKKGFPFLLRAMSLVVQEVPDVTLDIIGDGPQRIELEKISVDLGLVDTVRFRGSLSHAETLLAMGTSPVFALACIVPGDGDSDAMPVVLREAMARARGVVTTAVAGIPESLDETTGWVVPPEQPTALAQALIDALTQDEERRARGHAARDRVAERYTLAHTVTGMRSVFGLDRPGG